MALGDTISTELAYGACEVVIAESRGGLGCFTMLRVLRC